MKLSKKVEYALKIIAHLGRYKTKTGHQIAEELKLSRTFVDQVARQLRISSLIKSKKGPNGGYAINNPELTLGDLLKSVKSEPNFSSEDESIRGVENLYVNTIGQEITNAWYSALNTKLLKSEYLDNAIKKNATLDSKDRL